MTALIRQVGTIAAHHLRRLALGGAPIWLVAMPLVIIYVLGITMHGLFSAEFVPAKPYRVVIAKGEEPSNMVAGDIAQRLSQAPDFFAVDRVSGEDDARRAVLEREADAAIIVTQGAPAYTIIAPPGSIVLEMLVPALRQMDQEFVSQPGPDEMAPLDDISEPAETNSTSMADKGDGLGSPSDVVFNAPWVGVGAFQYFSAAIMIMFMTFASHSAMTNSAEDRTTGAYLRIRSMGISRSTYLVAGVASAAVIGALFALMMAVITRVLFRVEWGDPVAWTLMTIGGAMSIAALSFLVMAVLPDNPKSVESAGGTIYTILSFFGGSTVPLTVMPQWFAQLFSWLPNRRMLDGYLAIAQGAGVANLGREFLGLAVATLALLALSSLVLTIKKEGV